MKKSNLGILVDSSSLVDNLLEIDSFELGYTPRKDEELDASKQLARIRQEKKYIKIANQGYLLAEQNLRNYIVPVIKTLKNGFQELLESNKRDIIGKVSFKIKDIASSTGLCKQKRDELAEKYIAKIERLYYHYSAKSLN